MRIGLSVLLLLAGCTFHGPENYKAPDCKYQSEKEASCPEGYHETGIITRYDVGNIRVCCK